MNTDLPGAKLILRSAFGYDIADNMIKDCLELAASASSSTEFLAPPLTQPDTKAIIFRSPVNETLKVSTDPVFYQNLQVNDCAGVAYFGDLGSRTARGELGKCSSVLEVLSYVMNEVNDQNGELILGYGGLIHSFREKEFVNPKTGQYIDNDFDLWTSEKSVATLIGLEPELFRQFGWTGRAFKTRSGHVHFMQFFETCGANLNRMIQHKCSKIKSTKELGFEVYLLARLGNGLVKDAWQDNIFTESEMFPTQHVHFQSPGLGNTALNLQYPAKPFSVMACLYGDWTVPSSKHAPRQFRCNLSNETIHYTSTWNGTLGVRGKTPRDRRART